MLAIHVFSIFTPPCVTCNTLSYGSATPLLEIGRRSRCATCGTKGGSVQVVAVRWSDYGMSGAGPYADIGRGSGNGPVLT